MSGYGLAESLGARRVGAPTRGCGHAAVGRRPRRVRNRARVGNALRDGAAVPRRPGLPAAPGPVPDLPRVHRTAEHPPAWIAEQVRAGRWIKVARGAYVDAPASTLDRFARERQLGLATLAAARTRLAADRVLSHGSAALLWGLPVPADRSVHVTQTWSTGGGRGGSVVRHVLPLPDEDVTTRGGHLVTTLERTAVDCALVSRAADALVVMDAALHLGADRETCRDLLERRARSRGIRVARAALEVADDGAESPGETRARLAVLRLGVLPPETQVRVDTAAGTYWSDLGWPEWLVVAEYDGVAKYSARGSAVAELLRERRRQEAIEETGRSVVRIVSQDLADPHLLGRWLRRLLPARAFGHRIDPYLR